MGDFEGYCFEPEYSEDEIPETDYSMPVISTQDQTEKDHEKENRFGNTDWCKCGNCQTNYLSTVEEYRCCKEYDSVLKKIDSVPCITRHSSFDKLILDNEVLELGIMYYHADNRKPLPDPMENE